MASTDFCEFPLFRERFLGAALWNVDHKLATDQNHQVQAAKAAENAAPKKRMEHSSLGSSATPTPGSAAAATPSPARGLTSPNGASLHPRLNLKSLDLKALPRDDGPPSETQLRRQKFLFYEKQCSECMEGLFLAGDYVAKNREILQQNGVTHVFNCVGFVCKEYFASELEYKTLFLQDTPAEDILCVLYDAFDFIDNALKSGGKVLVHCSQGVSRSATIVIAYIMWRTNRTYDEVYAAVKNVRGVANPNIGFTCQLLQWQKRRAQPPQRCRMYRLAAHCAHAPLYLVPKIVTPPKKYANNTWRDLDRRGAFLLHTPSKVYVWRGAACPDAYVTAALRHATLLAKYEGAPPDPLVVLQGQEPADFIALMDPPLLDPEQQRINARRASITGDLLLSSTGPMDSASLLGGGPGGPPSTSGAGPEPMDESGPCPTPGALGPAAGLGLQLPPMPPLPAHLRLNLSGMPGSDAPTPVPSPMLISPALPQGSATPGGAPSPRITAGSSQPGTPAGPAAPAVLGGSPFGSPPQQAGPGPSPLGPSPLGPGVSGQPGSATARGIRGTPSTSSGGQGGPGASPFASIALPTAGGSGFGALLSSLGSSGGAGSSVAASPLSSQSNLLLGNPQGCSQPHVPQHPWAVPEQDEYGTEYALYSEAAAKAAAALAAQTQGSPSGTLLMMAGGQPDCPELLRINSDNSPGASPAAMLLRPVLAPSPAASAMLAQLPYMDPDARPDSPASLEGRMKKYRRSESEVRMALMEKQRRHFPSLHTSIDEEDMPMPDSLG